MSNENILWLICFIAGFSFLFYRRKEKPSKAPYPSIGCTTMQYYDADYIILSAEIENARNIYHLEVISEEIKDFKRRYRAYQEPVILQIDVNRLRRMWKEKKITYEIRSAIF